MAIENIKDAYNDEYTNICYKYNCKVRHQNFTNLDEKESINFVKKIIQSQYGFEIKKDKESYKMMIPIDSTGNIWNKLFEYKNNKQVENENLNQIIKPVNVNEKGELDEGFIED